LGHGINSGNVSNFTPDLCAMSENSMVQPKVHIQSAHFACGFRRTAGILLLTSVLSGALAAQTETTLDSLLNIKGSTAATFEQTVSEAPASVSVITAQEIRVRGFRTFDEVLATVRGFYTSYDRNYTYVAVRGFARPTDYNDRAGCFIQQSGRV
jgi:outer membrane receptor protein involved in Fe transport